MFLYRKDETSVIWEHIGLTDNEEYIIKANRKLAEYRSCGYSIMKNLICTYEEDISNEENLEMIISKYEIDI